MSKKKPVKGLIRLGVLPLGKVLPCLSTIPAGILEDNLEKITIIKKQRSTLGENGFNVCINSLRLVTFKTKGIKCVKCGVEGSFFAVEKSHGSKLDIPHLNLYAGEEEVSEVLMTHDHIIARSKGGKDRLNNTQTMCVRCNAAKGNK